MVQSLLAAWRVSLHRTTADWPIVTAAALISVLAATLLAAGPIYSNAVSEAGLRRTLADAPMTEANIEISARVAPADVESANATVEGLANDAVGSTGAIILAAGVSDSFAVPGQADGEIRDLVKLGFKDGLDAHAQLVEGAWPTTAVANAPVQVAALEAVASTLGLHVGDRLSLTSRLNQTLTTEVEIAGIYRATDPTDPFWWEDAALLDGLVESDQYRTFGPLFTTRTDLASRATADDVLLTWHVFPNFAQLQIGEVPGLQARVEALPDRVREALPDGFATASTGLPARLAEAERSLLASRTGVVLLLVQLAVLAGYAIVLTADLIVDHRRLDTAQLRSRGASTTQVGFLALAEAALLAVPAALAGPSLAAAALRLFNVGGPLVAIGLEIDPKVTPDAYFAAAAAAAGCAGLLVLPAFLAARSYAAEREGRARPATRPLGQRVGLDIALLALTAVGLWQLRLYGSPLTRTVQGSLGLDPLLVAAPAIGILAGSVLALRIVPLLAHAADRVASRSRGLVGSMSSRQLARRPLRYTRTALLLMLAMSMGVFSVSYGSTWAASQRDQADYQVGADVRVTPARQVDALPGWALEKAYGSIPGVDAVVPLARSNLRLTSTAPTGELLALDPPAAAAAVAMRNRADAGAFANLASELTAARPTAQGIVLTGEPRRLALAATIRLDSVALIRPGADGQPVFTDVPPEAILPGSSIVPSVTVRDGSGLLHRFLGEPTPIAGDGWQFIVPIAANTSARRATTERLGGVPDYPLEVVGVELEIDLPLGALVTAGRIALDGIATSADTTGASWLPLDIALANGWSVGWSEGGAPPTDVTPDAETHTGVDIGSLAAGGPSQLPGVDRSGRGVLVALTPTDVHALARDELTAIVNQPFLDALSADVGDSVHVTLPGGTRSIRIVGAIDSFPTTEPEAPVAIVDLATFGALRFGADHQVQLVDEWWLDLDGSAPAGAASLDAIEAARVTGVLAGATVTSREATRQRLSTDPLALATIGALVLGFVVAGLFAVIGLTVSAAVSARQRRTEFALLRALGLSPNQLSGWLLLENGSLVVVSIAAGTLLGLVIGWVVLPFITVTQGGAIPFPPVLVDVPWSSILVLEAVSIAALAVTLVLLARSMRRAGVGSVLRMGED
jgi:hypothetical protein